MTKLTKEALKETILFLEAPPGSPRHWPVARANLYRLVKRAYEEGKTTKKGKR